MRLLATALVAVLLASSAKAATIGTTTAPTGGREWALSTTQFDASASPECGSGESILPGTCQVQLVKSNSGAAAFGRFNPLTPSGDFIDSQDLPNITWTIKSERAFTRLTFAIMDAYDTGDFFRIDAAGASWNLQGRQANANIQWLNLNFEAPTTTAVLNFSTTRNDGFAVAVVRFDNDVAPVPLPATAGLLVSALGAVAALRRRRRAA